MSMQMCYYLCYCLLFYHRMSDYNRKDELNRALAYAVRGNILADVTECIRSGADLDARHRFLYVNDILGYFW